MLWLRFHVLPLYHQLVIYHKKMESHGILLGVSPGTNQLLSKRRCAPMYGNFLMQVEWEKDDPWGFGNREIAEKGGITILTNRRQLKWGFYPYSQHIWINPLSTPLKTITIGWRPWPGVTNTTTSSSTSSTTFTISLTSTWTSTATSSSSTSSTATSSTATTATTTSSTAWGTQFRYQLDQERERESWISKCQVAKMAQNLRESLAVFGINRPVFGVPTLNPNSCRNLLVLLLR